MSVIEDDIVDRLAALKSLYPSICGDAIAEIERLKASALSWELIARHHKRWDELPHSKREAALQKALDETMADLVKAEEEIERLRHNALTEGQ